MDPSLPAETPEEAMTASDINDAEVLLRRLLDAAQDFEAMIPRRDAEAADVAGSPAIVVKMPPSLIERFEAALAAVRDAGGLSRLLATLRGEAAQGKAAPHISAARFGTDLTLAQWLEELAKERGGVGAHEDAVNLLRCALWLEKAEAAGVHEDPIDLSDGIPK